MYNFTVFICDDESIILEGLANVINKKFPGVKIETFFTTDALIERLYEVPNDVDILFLDYFFHGGVKGTEAIPEIREICPELPIILLTGHTEYNTFAGLEDYNMALLIKPSTDAEIFFEIERSLKGTEKYKQLKVENKRLDDELTHLRQALVKSIGVDIDEDMVDLKEDWRKYEDQVMKVLESHVNKVELRMIQENIKKRYPALPQGDMIYLATGEYLRRNIKESKIDYSPMLIAYGKSLEAVLFKLLKKLNVKKLEDKRTLKSLIDLCTAKSNLFSRQLIMQTMLRQFMQLRNKAAHKDGVNNSELIEAKAVLFELDRPCADTIFDELNIIFARL